MGIYINPIKEDYPTDKWDIVLGVAGKQVQREDFIRHTPGKDETYGVCLVHNGASVAAGVAFNSYEAEALTNEEDGRRRAYCLLRMDQIWKLDPYAAQKLLELNAQAA